MEAYKKLVLLMGLAVALAAVAANGEFTMCGMTVDGLTSCQPAVSGASPAKPTGKCCKALSKADLPCFCRLMKSYSKGRNSYGINVDRAKKLPGVCKISTPFRC